MRLNIENNRILLSIPYKPSKYYQKTFISNDEIECIIYGYMWPAIKTKTNEIFIFSFSDEDKVLLSNYGICNKLDIVTYDDIWSDILEPFLDTEYSEKTKNIINNRLERSGFEKSEIKKIRSEIKEIINDYNNKSGLWDWVNLSMNDLLDACIGKLNTNIKMNDEYFEEHYWFVMSIQEKGRHRTTAST